MAATVLKHVVYSGAELMSFNSVVGLMAFLAVPFIVPLTAFVPVLSALKRNGLRRYGLLVTTHNRAFENEVDRRRLTDRRANSRWDRRTSRRWRISRRATR